MRKKLRYLIFAVFLLTIFRAQVYALEPESHDSQKIETAILKKGGIAVADKNVIVITRPKVEYRAQGLRNPFEQPPLGLEIPDANVAGPKEVSIPLLTVQGVIWGTGLPQAIINNKVVKTGDILEGAEVSEINKQGVTVIFAGVEHQLTTLPK